MMKLAHIAITVKDLGRSIDFYQKFFDFTVEKEFKRDDLRAKAVMINSDEFVLELWEFKDGKENKDDLNDIKVRGLRHIAFEVENLKESIEYLGKKGLEFSEPKKGASGHWYAYTHDPDGVPIELYEK